MLHDLGCNIESIKDQTNNIIAKTLFCILPQMQHMYKTCSNSESNQNMCFEILGFDILVDQKEKAWLLEVNHAPSFNSDTQVDWDVKSALLTDTFKILNIKQTDRQRVMRSEKKHA